MAMTPSKMLALDTKMPEFSLPNVLTDSLFSSKTLANQDIIVVLFICNHCPFVIHIREQMVLVARDFLPKGVEFIAINSNDVEAYPADRPEEMARMARELAMPFPYLFDESQDVARAFLAACTPDIFVFKDLKLVYRGQFDDSRPGNGKPVTGKDLRLALQALVDGGKPSSTQVPSIGCNIKWKKN